MIPDVIKRAEMSPEMKELVRQLRKYCDQEKGRRSTVSKEIGVSMQSLWNILNDGQEPTGSQTLKILEILGRLK